MVHRLRLRASTPGGAATNVGASTQVPTSAEASLASSSTQVATSGGVAGASGATRGDPGVDARAQGDGHRCLLRLAEDVAWRSRTPVHTADAIAALTCWGAGLITRNAGADGAAIPTPALDGWQCDVSHGVVQAAAAALARLRTRFDIVGVLLQELLAQQMRQRGDQCDRGRVITGRGNGTEDVRLKANELFLMVNGLVTTRPCQSTSCM